MIRAVLFAAAVSVLAVPAAAASCRDARGKFIKCPAVSAPAPKRCKDAKGKFTRCGTPGAVPITPKT